jgi:hypothetical protein
VPSQCHCQETTFIHLHSLISARSGCDWVQCVFWNRECEYTIAGTLPSSAAILARPWSDDGPPHGQPRRTPPVDPIRPPSAPSHPITIAPIRPWTLTRSGSHCRQLSAHFQGTHGYRFVYHVPPIPSIFSYAVQLVSPRASNSRPRVMAPMLFVSWHPEEMISLAHPPPIIAMLGPLALMMVRSLVASVKRQKSMPKLVKYQKQVSPGWGHVRPGVPSL